MQGAVVASTPKVIPGQSMAPIQEKCKTSIATINGALDSLKANQEVLCLSNNKCLVKRNWCLGLSFGGGFVSLGGSIGILFVAITSSIFWPLVLVTAGIAIIASALGAIGVSYNFKLNDLSEEIKGNNENIRFRESRAGHNEVRMQIEHEERKSDVSHDFSQICPYSLTNGLAEKGEGVFRRDVLRGASNVYSLKIEGEALSFRYEGEGVARPLFINFLNDFYDNLYSDIGSLVNQLQVDSGENLTIDNAVEYDSEIDAHRLYVNYDRVIQSMSDKKDSLEMLFAAWKTQDPEFCESEGVKGSMDAILETFNTALTMTQDSSNSKIVILRKIDKMLESFRSLYSDFKAKESNVLIEKFLEGHDVDKGAYIDFIKLIMGQPSTHLCQGILGKAIAYNSENSGITLQEDESILIEPMPKTEELLSFKLNFDSSGKMILIIKNREEMNPINITKSKMSDGIQEKADVGCITSFELRVVIESAEAKEFQGIKRLTPKFNLEESTCSITMDIAEGTPVFQPLAPVSL